MPAVPFSCAHARADRLLGEARNCLAIAVGERDQTFAGTLIDEALRLARRARELRIAG